MENKIINERTAVETYCCDASLKTTVTHNGINYLKWTDTFVKIELENLCNYGMKINNEEVEKIEFTVCGNYEREILINALKFLTKELEENK